MTSAAVKTKAKAAAKRTRAPTPAKAGHATATPHGVEPAVLTSLMEQALRYQIELWQRSLMLLDTFRERANKMLAHETAGMPPPLTKRTRPMPMLKTFLAIRKISVGTVPIQLAATPDSRTLLVANQGSRSKPGNTVSMIDIKSRAVVSAVRVGKGPNGVSVSP